MIFKNITPLILTYNEAPNIKRSIQKLYWATRIVVIDSNSTDDTLDILQSYPQVEVLQRTFDSHATQWNYGLEQIQTEWVLSLDADYVLTDELMKEIKSIPDDITIDGYFIPFKYCIFGNPLRGTILPPRQALFRKKKSLYIDDGHTQVLEVKGKSGYLKNYILHDDRKSLKRWLWAQDRYMIIEAKKLIETPFKQLSLGDKIRKQGIVAPFVILFYCLILKGGILDGWIGWYYALQRMAAEIILSLRILEKKHHNAPH